MFYKEKCIILTENAKRDIIKYRFLLFEDKKEDEIYEKDNFRNEIVWYYGRWSTPSKKF